MERTEKKVARQKSAAFMNPEKVMMANKIIVLRQQIMYRLFDCAIMMTEDEEQRRVLKNKIKDICQRSENNILARLKADETAWTLKMLLEAVYKEFTEVFPGNLASALSLFFLDKEELRMNFFNETDDSVTVEIEHFQEEFVDFLNNEPRD